MENNKLNEKDKSGFFSKLSRTLYIGNLDENINDATLYKYFGEFGDIISINIKKEGYVNDKSLKVYAFIIYFDTSSVVLAMLKMNGVNIEGCHVCLGFGRSYPSKCVWITGIKQSEDNNFLLTFLADCGPIITCLIDQINERAIIYFKEIVNAETAINKMKDGFLNGLYFHGDYASSECQVKFVEFYNKRNHKNCLSINLDKITIQNPSIHIVNKQKSAGSHYAKVVNSWIASKESTSQIPCIWVDGIADSVSNEYLESLFSQFGPIRKCLIDRFNKHALLCFQEELHAQSGVTVMNGSYIEGESVHVHLAYIRCRACEISNTNNDNFTIQQQANTGQLSPYSERHVDPYYKCTINDETCPINIRDPRNNSIYDNNAQGISQHKYLNISNINIPNDSSNTNANDSSITIIFNEYPPPILKSLPQFADSDVLSLPMPKFAKNISKEITTTFLRYSLSSNADVNQAYSFNVHHDDIKNCGFGYTDKWNKQQYQSNNHSPKSVELATEQQGLLFEETKKPQNVLNKYTPKQFIQHQSSLKFQDQQLSSSLSTLSSSSDSSKYGLDLSASVNQSQYCPPNDTKSIIIPQNSKTPLIDSQILHFGPKLLIDQNVQYKSRMVSNINGLLLKKQNICSMSNNMQTSDAINTDFINPMPGDENRQNELFEKDYRTQDEYTKHWATTSKRLTNTQNYVEKLDHLWFNDTCEKENEDQKKLQNKNKSLDISVAENSIGHAVRPIIDDVEKSSNIDEENMDNTVDEKSIANILLSLNKNFQNKIVSNETRDKIEKTNHNVSASSISNNGDNKNNNSVYYNHVEINNYTENESQKMSSISLIGGENHNIKYNTIQDEVEKTNDDEYNTKHLNIKTNMEWKNPILYIDLHEKENQLCKSSTTLDSKSIKPKENNKCTLFENDMFKIKQTINKNKEIMVKSETKNIECNKNYKFGEGLTAIKEEKQNVDIHKKYSHFNLNIKDDNKFKTCTKKVDGNITSSYCSTENSLKRIISNSSENHNDSKRQKINNKAYGWRNGYSISEILSNASKAAIYSKVKV